jgi:hypothetical protein
MSAPALKSAERPVAKALRIGVVQDRKVVSERLIRAGELVTIGESQKCTFVLPEAGLGQRHELFIPRGDGFILNVPDTVSGAIQQREEPIRTLEQLVTGAQGTKKGNLYNIPLNDSQKGKLTVGGITLLFQFVPAPPEPMKAINPGDFRPRLVDEDDALFLTLLALFWVIGGTLSVWAWVTPIPDRLDLDNVDDVAALLIDQKIAKVTIQDPLAKTEDPAKPKEEDKPAETKPAETKPAPAGPVTDASVTSKSALLALLGTNGDAAGGISDILGDEAATRVALDSALAGVNGVQLATGDNVGIKSGGGGGREDAKVGLGLATGGTGVGTGTGVATVVKKPKVDYGAVDADTDEGDSTSIPSIVRKSSGRIQTCVEQSLKKNPSMSGRVVVTFAIAQGKVTSSSATSNTTGDDEVGQCIARTVRSIRFPEDLTAPRVEIPFAVSGQ